MSNIDLSNYGNIPLNTKPGTMGATPAGGNAFNNYSGQITPGVSQYLPSSYSSNNNALAPTFTQPVGGATNNSLAGYQDILNGLDNRTNAYYDQLGGLYQNQYNNQMDLYNKENTQALGTQGADASNAFLNSIYDPLLRQQGALQYQYGLDLGHTNDVYGLSSTANQQNRDLALSKLATDEQNNLAQLGLNHGQSNAAKVDELNSRGMLYGQAPTGMYQDQNIGGLHGLAGQQAGIVNTDFANQRNQIVQPYQQNVLGANQAYNQQQGMLDTNHTYDTKNLAAGTVGNINNQNNQYAYNTTQANNALAQYKLATAQQQQNDINTNKQNAYSQTLIKNNAYTGS